MKLWRGEREYILKLNRLLREATQKCSAASDTWNRRNDEFNTWYAIQFPGKMGWSEIDEKVIPSDSVHYVGLKKPNLGLQDAENSWYHWQREVMRLAAAIQGQIQTHQLLDDEEADDVPIQRKGAGSCC